MHIEERRLKSSIPYYTLGTVWIIYGILFPMYTLKNLIFATAISVVAFILAFRLAKDTLITVESNIPSTGNETADSHIQLGRKHIKRMYEINLNGTKLEKDKENLLELSNKIIDFVVKYPQKARNLNSWLDYYLPTTITLLENYSHLVSQGQTSDNIIQSKEKIEHIIPNMITAFEKQLDSLFGDKALDISSEISLLKDLLKREGLQ